MKILSLHNRYLIRGGEDESHQLENSMLRSHGHEVIEFTEDNKRIAQLSSLQIALRTIWSKESYQRLRRLIRETKPDLMHVQNFFPLISPAAYYAAKAENVPVVQTLRNYRLLCPNAFFFRGEHVCEECLGRLVPWPGIIHACYRGNRAATTTVAAMLTIHNALNTWDNMISRYITLTEFARNKFIQGGFPAEKITVKPNFIDPDPGLEERCDGYALYVGRLSNEKGINTLLTVWKNLNAEMSLIIVGDGPLTDYVAEAVKLLPGVTLLGRKSAEEVSNLMGKAMVLIFPSEWYETFGRVAIEAFAKGTPVIAARIGAIAEIVEDGVTGIHFEAGNAEDLAAKVKWVAKHPEEMHLMGQNGRRIYEEKYTVEKNYLMLMDIYQRVIDKKK